MDRQGPVIVPESLRYRDGLYKLERFSRAGALTGVAALTTTGRNSGKPRTTFVRAFRDGDKANLVSVGGEHALWLKNIRANPRVTLRFRRDTLSGTARNPHNDGERQAVDDAFCDSTHPFDYAERRYCQDLWIWGVLFGKILQTFRHTARAL